MKDHAVPMELPEAAPRRFGQRLPGNLEGGLVPQAGPVCEVRGGNCQRFGVVPDLAMYPGLRTATAEAWSFPCG